MISVTMDLALASSDEETVAASEKPKIHGPWTEEQPCKVIRRRTTVNRTTSNEMVRPGWGVAGVPIDEAKCCGH